MQRVRRIPAAVEVYSNMQDAVAFVAHRSASWLPDPLVGESMQPNTKYDEQRAEMCRRVAAAAAVLAFFTTDGSGDPGQQGEAMAMCPFVVTELFPDGALFASPLP